MIRASASSALACERWREVVAATAAALPLLAAIRFSAAGGAGWLRVALHLPDRDQGEDGEARREANRDEAARSHRPASGRGGEGNAARGETARAACCAACQALRIRSVRSWGRAPR